MAHYGLGRIPSKFDARDYALADFMPLTARKKLIVAPDTSWKFLAPPLNQDDTNHCVGFSMADWGICLPVQDNYNNENGHAFYYKCKIIDGEPNQENGSCIRSAAKVLKKEGKIDAYAFAASVDEMKWWLVNKSPMIIGTLWLEGMFSPGSDNIIHTTGDVAGGHAYLIDEIKGNTLLGIQNSWGSNWGINGKAYIPISEFITLFRNGGEALASVELPIPVGQTETSTCWLFTLLNSLRTNKI